MKLTTIAKACLLSAMMMGMMPAALPALAMPNAMAQREANGKEWTLLETKDGVSCYYRIDNLGTGAGVFLRFENHTNASAEVKWTVTSADREMSGKVNLAAGQALDSSTNSSLGMRVADGKPVISIAVSK